MVVFAKLSLSKTIVSSALKRKDFVQPAYYNFSFSHTINLGFFEDLDWEGDFEKNDIELIADEVVGNYEFAPR